MALGKKCGKAFIFLVMLLIINLIIIRYANFNINTEMILDVKVMSNKEGIYQVFYSESTKFKEDKSISVAYEKKDTWQNMRYNIPKNTSAIRIDLGTQESVVKIEQIMLSYLSNEIDIKNNLLNKDNQKNNIKSIITEDQHILVQSKGNDPFIILKLDDLDLIRGIDESISWLFKAVLCLVATIILVVLFKVYKSIYSLMLELYGNKKLIWDLARNDFKTKYAGSYLGIIWAFVQPVVSVLIYWFVFQVGFKSAPVSDFPFVLWLIVGIVPWFFFSDAIVNATNSMIEYSYLVKKVVFKISILPIVKILSALFVHLFFIVFTVVLFLLYGYMPTIHIVQVIYYTFCTFVLVLGICYATCAIIIFFRDIGQIINIVLQIGLWMTPIMWSYEMIPNQFQWILKINPMYYIVEGYRDAFINHVWIWDRYNQTIYFWIITSAIFGLGSVIFKKLKIHFADVL